MITTNQLENKPLYEIPPHNGTSPMEGLPPDLLDKILSYLRKIGVSVVEPENALLVNYRWYSVLIASLGREVHGLFKGFIQNLVNDYPVNDSEASVLKALFPSEKILQSTSVSELRTNIVKESLNAYEKAIKMWLSAGIELDKEDVLKRAFHLCCSAATLKRILDLTGIELDRRMLIKALESRCSLEVIELILDRGGIQPDDGMLLVALRSGCSVAVIELILDRGGIQFCWPEEASSPMTECC